MKRALFFFILIGATWSVLAQNAVKANELFEQGDYAAALPVYQALLQKAPRNVLYAYRCARCLQQTERYSEALPLFDKTKQKYPLALFFTGECYMSLWMPDEAIEAYTSYLERDTKSNRKEYVEQQMQKAAQRKRYIKRVQQVQIIDFTVIDKRQFLQAYLLSTEAGSILADTNGCVTYTNQRGDRRIFAVQDTDKTLLVSQYRLLQHWSSADTLPRSVNFTAQQNFPFSLSDGITTYFAARDTNGFGGWDIYVTRYNSANNTYTTPENIGLPFNSEANDYMLVMDETKQVGYFATDRFCASDSVCVYQFVLQAGNTVYLPPMPADSLALYAQLKRYIRVARPSESVQTDAAYRAVDTLSENPSFRLYISSDVIYTSEHDFISSEALDLYRRYREQEAELQGVDKQLDEARQAYTQADDAQRESIARQIGPLENRQTVLRQRNKQLLNRIRQMEVDARKEKITNNI